MKNYIILRTYKKILTKSRCAVCLFRSDSDTTRESVCWKLLRRT